MSEQMESREKSTPKKSIYSDARRREAAAASALQEHGQLGSGEDVVDRSNETKIDRWIVFY